ncbi:hypothetical protein ACFQ2B_33230 [Streptomyces stramineus]
MTDVTHTETVTETDTDTETGAGPAAAEIPPHGSLLHLLFDEQAARSPHQIAVRDARGSLTYAQLAQRSDWLAAHLAERLPRPGSWSGCTWTAVPTWSSRCSPSSRADTRTCRSTPATRRSGSSSPPGTPVSA